MIRKVIDISRHQEYFDPQKARKQGIDGVMIRGAYGFSEDSHFLCFALAAHSAGLAVGSYISATWHYAQISPSYEDAKRNARRQAQAYVKILKKAPINSFAALHLELESGNTCLLTAQQLTECANLFLNILKKHGYRPLLYCSIAWLFYRMDETRCKYPLWLSYYYFNSVRDVDFNTPTAKNGCLPDTDWGQKMKALGPRLALWQFGYKSGGRAYGTGSENINKNWAYQPLKRFLPFRPTRVLF